ncbi:MAG: hypothetical protein MK135_07220 [Polyangiaceae bacterium]|nr:hypothetical protein [Polyangiaceae bacterium]
MRASFWRKRSKTALPFVFSLPLAFSLPLVFLLLVGLSLVSAPSWAQPAVEGDSLGDVEKEDVPKEDVEKEDVPKEKVSQVDSAGSEESPGDSSPDESTAEVDAKAQQEATLPPGTRLGLWGRPVKRQGFHFQLGFGVGGGPDTVGLFHEMELGWTTRGYTFGMVHTFIQNKGFFGTEKGGPDLIGGWMFQFKMPIYWPDLVVKVALGLGGTHEQADGKIIAHPGFGASYGVDFHFPIWPRFGPTLSLVFLNVTAEGQHHFGASGGLAITLF